MMSFDFSGEAPRDFLGRMDIAWQLLMLAAGPDPLAPEACRIDPDTGELRRQNGAFAPDPRLLPPDAARAGDERDQLYTLGLLLHRLFAEKDVLQTLSAAEIGRRCREDPAGTLLAEADLQAIRAEGADEEELQVLRDCIRNLTAFRPELRDQAAVALYEACVRLPCQYILRLLYPDGTPGGEVAIDMTRGLEQTWLGDAAEPVVTLADGGRYSFLPELLRFRPGIHLRRVRAIRQLGPAQAVQPGMQRIPPPAQTPGTVLPRRVGLQQEIPGFPDRDLGIVTEDLRFTAILPAGMEYTGGRARRVRRFRFFWGGSLRREIGLYSRTGGSGTARLPLFAKNSPIRKIGALVFERPPGTEAAECILEVAITPTGAGTALAEGRLLQQDGSVLCSQSAALRENAMAMEKGEER